MSGQSAVTRTITSARVSAAAPAKRASTSSSSPRNTPWPAARASSATGSSVALVVVVTTIPSAARARSSRARICASIGRPSRSISTLPGRRVDVIRAWTKISRRTSRALPGVAFARLALQVHGAVGGGAAPHVHLDPLAVFDPPHARIAERVRDLVELWFRHLDITEPATEIARLHMIVRAHFLDRLFARHRPRANVFARMIGRAPVAELHEFQIVVHSVFVHVVEIGDAPVR